MDKQLLSSDPQLLANAAVAARQWGVTLTADRITHGTGADARTVRYTVEACPTLQLATLGATLQRLARFTGYKALLVADYVGPALADELKARDIAFIDTVGNAYLADGPLLIWVKGQKRPAKPAAIAMGRAFQPTGLQVVFTLLCNPAAINRPYRELAAMAGVAHGTVGWVIPDLQQQGFVDDLNGKRGTRRLFQHERLLNQWVDAYARVLRPRLLLGRYFAPTLEDWQNWPLPDRAAWGGEPAAALLTEHLRPGELTLYAAQIPALLAARQQWLKAPDAAHPTVVEVRYRFWRFPDDSTNLERVPPLLVYADLLATGDARCLETAQLIHDTYLTELFTAR